MNVLERLRAAFAAATPEGGDPAAFAAAVRAEQRSQVRRLPGQRLHGPGQGAEEEPARAGRRRSRPRSTSSPLAGPPEVAGPGFLNVRLHDDWIAQTLGDLLGDDRLGLAPPAKPQTVVIDYSSPNVAKPMHVGHIRSTVIGDSLARIFAALGHKVIRDNHLGDWGSQFGMILWGWKNDRDEAAFAADPVAELARLYRLAQDRIKAGDRPVEDAARAETAKLHAGDPENRALWEQFMPHCLAALQAVYDRLGVRFDVQLGESFYDPMLAEVVDDLDGAGASPRRARGRPSSSSRRRRPRSSSASATGPSTTPRPTWRRSSTASRPGTPTRSSTWSTTARATTSSSSSPSPGSGATTRSTSSTSPSARSSGADRRPFKTREGDVVGLESLLDEAVAEARKVVDENSPDLDPEERPRVAEVVGLGAIKYADLSQNRLSDYVFDWQKMLAMNGNTGDLSPVRLRPDPEHLPQGRRSTPRRSASSSRRSS